MFFRKKKTKKGKSIASIVGGTLIASGMIAGTAASTYVVCNKYISNDTQTNDTRYVNAKFKLSSVNEYVNADFNHTSQGNYVTKEATDRSALAFSNYLKSENNQKYTVWSEYDSVNKFAYINAVLADQKKQINGKNQDLPLMLNLFNTIQDNNLYFVYETSYDTSDTNSKPVFTILPFSQVFDYSGTTAQYSQKQSTYGVWYSIKQNFKDFFKYVYEEFLQYSKKDSTYKGNHAKPRIMIVKNINNIINAANFYISLGNNIDNPDAFNVYKYIKGSSEATFISDYSKYKLNYLQDAKVAKYTDLVATTHLSEPSKTVSMPYGDVLDKVIGKSSGTTAGYSWYSSDYINEISVDNYTNWIPDKLDDSHTNGIDLSDSNNPKVTDVSHFFISKSSKNLAKSTITDEQKYASDTTAYVYDVKNDLYSNSSTSSTTSSTPSWSTIAKYYDSNYGVSFIDQEYSTNFLKSTNLFATEFIAFAIFILVLGIWLMAVYRSSGAISWIATCFLESITFLIMSFKYDTISFSMVFGIFALAIISVIIALNTTERLRHQLRRDREIPTAVNKTFGKISLFVTDCGILLILLGIALLYLSTSSLATFGLLMICGGVLFPIIFGPVSWLISYLLFCNRIMYNKKGLLTWYRKKVISIKASVVNDKFKSKWYYCPSKVETTVPINTSFSSLVLTKTNINLFNPKLFVILGLFLAVVIISIVLIFVRGFESLSIFSYTQRIVISSAQYSQIISSGQGIEFGRVVFDNTSGLSFCYLKNTLSQSQIQYLNNLKIFIQSLNGDESNNSFHTSLICISVVNSLTIVYGFVRLNWTSFLPLIVSCGIIPTFAIIISFQLPVKFDENIVYGLVFSSLINNIFCINLIFNINTKWLRDVVYPKEHLRYLINNEVKSWSRLLITFYTFVILFLIGFSLTMPVEMINVLLVIVVSFICYAVFNVYLIPFVLYWMLVLRTKYISKYSGQIKAMLNKSSYLDEIDEQIIEGINVFKNKVEPE